MDAQVSRLNIVWNHRLVSSHNCVIIFKFIVFPKQVYAYTPPVFPPGLFRLFLFPFYAAGKAAIQVNTQHVSAMRACLSA